MRIGQGFDVHALAAGRRLVLGGVAIPHGCGLEGHSDADVLLRQVAALVTGQGYGVGNVDATIIAQAPKVAPYVEAMRANIAADLQCDVGRISVKATTTEHLGFAGRGEGIAALATVLIVPNTTAQS